MSIKDKISFWQQKLNSEEVKPFPKPRNFEEKKTPSAQIPSNHQDSGKSRQEAENKLNHNRQPQFNKMQPQTKKTPVSSANLGIINSHASQSQTQTSSSLKGSVQFIITQPQRTQNPQQYSSISVKDRINKLNSLPLPILRQQPQSSILENYKKLQTQPIPNLTHKKSENLNLASQSNRPTNPYFQVEKEDLNKISFKDRRQMIDKMFVQRAQLGDPSKKHNPQQNQNQISENQNETTYDQNHTNHQKQLNQHELKQSIDHKREETNHEKNEGQKDVKDESRHQFMLILKPEQQNLSKLLNGQLNNLTLERRMTRRMKKKTSDDDFDDL